MKMEIRRRARGRQATYYRGAVRPDVRLVQHHRGTLQQVYPTFDQTEAPAVAFTFDSEGARTFASSEVTRRLHREGAPSRILLNGKLQSAPTSRRRSRGGCAGITGGLRRDRAAGPGVGAAGRVAAGGAGPSERDVRRPRARHRQPRPGLPRLRSSPFLIVVAFMLGYYLLAGAIADLALAFNLLFLRRGDDDERGGPHAARHRRHRAHRRHGRRRQRAHLRARARGAARRGQTLRTAIEQRLRARLRHHLRLQPHHAHHRRHPVSTSAPARSGASPSRSPSASSSACSPSLFITRVVFDFLVARGWLKERLVMMRLLSKTHVRFVKWAPAVRHHVARLHHRRA